MGNYYDPDDRWEILYQIDSRQAYEDKFVVKGKFHNRVPDDVKMDFEIAERLMAYSYYCYPMYDEALKKLLGMTEMAVKLRCTQLDISLDYKDKKGESKQRVLSQLIDLLLKRENDKPLHDVLTKARRIRNIFAHPDRHTFLGGMVYNSVIQVINTINFIFLDEQVFKESKNYLNELLQSNDPFEHGNFILEHNDYRYLAYCGRCLDVFKVKGEWIGLWVFYPVITNMKEQIEKNKYNIPIFTTLKDVEIKDSCLHGVDVASDKPVRFLTTTESKNLEKFVDFEQQLKECKNIDIELYKHWINEEIGKKIVHHRYKYYWE